MKRLVGDIVITKNVEHDYLYAAICETGEEISDYLKQDHVEVGRIAADIELIDDTRDKEIEILEKELKRKNAEHQRWVEMAQGKIQSLRALEHKA